MKRNTRDDEVWREAHIYTIDALTKNSEEQTTPPKQVHGGVPSIHETTTKDKLYPITNARALHQHLLLHQTYNKLLKFQWGLQFFNFIGSSSSHFGQQLHNANFRRPYIYGHLFIVSSSAYSSSKTSVCILCIVSILLIWNLEFIIWTSSWLVQYSSLLSYASSFEIWLFLADLWKY